MQQADQHDADPHFAAECRAAWDGDPALRAEFGGDFAIYKAYREADARGQVRVLGAGRTGRA